MAILDKRNTKKEKRKENKKFPYKKGGKYRTKEVKQLMSYKEKYQLLHEAASNHIIKKLNTNDFTDKLYEIDEQ